MSVGDFENLLLLSFFSRKTEVEKLDTLNKINGTVTYCFFIVFQ